jgi:hypothetical protein
MNQIMSFEEYIEDWKRKKQDKKNKEERLKNLYKNWNYEDELDEEKDLLEITRKIINE